MIEIDYDYRAVIEAKRGGESGLTQYPQKA